MPNKLLCKAFARSTGKPCMCKALKNGRCRFHGGLSTGPKTPEGKARISVATRRRMASGQSQLAKQGFQRWLSNGGRDYLVACAERRQSLKQRRAEGHRWLVDK